MFLNQEKFEAVASRKDTANTHKRTLLHIHCVLLTFLYLFQALLEKTATTTLTTVQVVSARMGGRV